jgi:hypothetical protein
MKKNKETPRLPVPGDRIRLVAMPSDPDPIPVGSPGTVVAVFEHDSWTQIDVDWDNGRTLMLTMPEDAIEIIRKS